MTTITVRRVMDQPVKLAGDIEDWAVVTMAMFRRKFPDLDWKIIWEFKDADLLEINGVSIKAVIE